MEPVKLDSPVKVFVVSVFLDSLEQLAMKKVMYYLYTDNVGISMSESLNSSIPRDPGTVSGEELE